MEAKEKLTQIVKPIKPEQTTANTGWNPIKQIFFEDYRSYKKYYKASVIYNTNFIRPQIYICRSYNTDIAIFNRMNGTLLLNLDYYNCSKTTKEQLNHFKFKYCFKPIRTIYLTDIKFNELLETFYTSDIGLYENKEYNIIKLYEHDKTIMDTLKNPYLNLNEKLEELKPYLNMSVDVDNSRYKTVKEVTYIYTSRNTRSNIKFKVIKHFKKSKTIKNSYKKVTHIKLTLPEEPNFYTDPRNTDEKKLYNGYDMGASNTKKDYQL